MSPDLLLLMDVTLRGLPPGTKIPFLQIKDIYLWEVEHLGIRFESDAKGILNKMHGVKSSTPIPAGPQFLRRSSTIASARSVSDSEPEKEIRIAADGEKTSYNKLIGIHECIIAETIRKPNDSQATHAYVRAGPRRELHFNPKKVSYTSLQFLLLVLPCFYCTPQVDFCLYAETPTVQGQCGHCHMRWTLPRA